MGLVSRGLGLGLGVTFRGVLGGQGVGLEGLGFELRFRGRGRKRCSSEVTSNKHDYKPCNNFVPSASKQAFEITCISACSQPTVGQKEEEEEKLT